MAICGMSFQMADLIPSVGAENAVALAVAAAAAAGIAAGLMYRAGAAVGLSFVAMFATLIAALGQGWPFWRSSLAAFGMMVVLQVGYLIGVAIAVVVQRAMEATGLRATLSSLFKRGAAR